MICFSLLLTVRLQAISVWTGRQSKNHRRKGRVYIQLCRSSVLEVAEPLLPVRTVLPETSFVRKWTGGIALGLEQEKEKYAIVSLLVEYWSAISHHPLSFQHRLTTVGG